MSLKITNLRLQPHLQGANELTEDCTLVESKPEKPISFIISASSSPVICGASEKGQQTYIFKMKTHQIVHQIWIEEIIKWNSIQLPWCQWLKYWQKFRHLFFLNSQQSVLQKAILWVVQVKKFGYVKLWVYSLYSSHDVDLDRTISSEIKQNTHFFIFNKIHLTMSSTKCRPTKCRPFCSGVPCKCINGAGTKLHFCAAMEAVQKSMTSYFWLEGSPFNHSVPKVKHHENTDHS